MFLNKQDRPGASFRSSLRSLLTHRLHPHPMVLTLPIASFDPKDYAHAEPGIQGLVDLAKWQVWRWDEDGQSTCHALPRDAKALENLDFMPSDHPIIPHLVPARTELLENLSMFSEDLMERLLGEPSSYLDITYAEIIPHLRKSSLENRVLPVVCGSAIKHIGTSIVMDYIGELFASPLDVPHDSAKNAPLRMLAWKVNWDKKRGWMTYVRIYSGRERARCEPQYITQISI